MNAQLEEHGNKPRKKRVVIQRKVSAGEYEEYKTKMESMGLDPSKDPVPPSFSSSSAPQRSSKASAGLSDNATMFAGLPAAAIGDKHGQPTLTASALNAQNGLTAQATETRAHKGQKMVSLQKRTIEEQIAHGRHDRVLDKWTQQQEAWENFRHHASKRTGRHKEELVVTRAEEHRERKEVMELIDRATPDEVLSGGHSWYHSLRGEGSRFITVGNMFSGLHLPVKMHKENVFSEIVRKPHLRDIAVHHRALKERGKHVRTWRDDEYLQARMRKYWKKMQEHAPGQLGMDELLEPTCIGIRPPENFEGFDGGEGDGDEGQAEEIFAIDGDQSGLEPIISGDLADETTLPTNELKEGPYIAVLPEQLQFQTTVKKLNTQCIKLKNVGTAVIQYEWILNDPQHGFQESVLPDDPTDRFMCATAKGQVLPGCEAQMLFSFTSSIPGNFVSMWRLSTYPDLLEPIDEVVMHGVAIEADGLVERRCEFQENIFKQQVLRQVQELINDVFEDVKLQPEPLPDLNAPLLQERLFEQSNLAFGLYWSPHSWQHLNEIGDSITQLKTKSLKGKPDQNDSSAEIDGSISQEVGQVGRGCRPIKKKRGPEGVSHKDLHTLSGVPSVSRLEHEIREVTGPKDSEILQEKREVTVDLNRAVRGARVRPLERSPLWWLAHETVMEIAKAVPRSFASARKSFDLAPIPFVPPIQDDAFPDVVAEHERKLDQRESKRGEDEKELEANAKFLEDFSQEHFGPHVSKFEAVAHETRLLTEFYQVAPKTLQERFAPYAGRSNSESVDINANVLMYEIDLEFLSAHTHTPPSEDGSDVRRREFHLTAEAEEQVKHRMQVLPPLLEISPLAIIVFAHVGRADPDPPQKERSPPAVQVVDDGVVEVDELDLAPGMRSLPSLEPIADLLRDATEGFASAVEFVPHTRWIHEAADFAAQVRADTSDNKVFLLENMAAIPEEVGERRFLSGGDENATAEIVNAVQVPWAAREAWAQRVLKELSPEIFVQDSFSSALQSHTLSVGLWPSAPQKVVGQLMESEIVGFCDALRLQFGSKAAETPAPKVADGAPIPAPLLIVLGGGGYGAPDGEAALIRKFEVLLGLAQLEKYEKDGVVISLGGEFCLVVLAYIFGVKVGKLDFMISDLALTALRDTLRDTLSLGVTIKFPTDVVAWKIPPPEPEPVVEPVEPVPKAKAKGKAAAAPPPPVPEPPAEVEKLEGEDGESGEDKNVQSFVLHSAFSAMAQTPVSLGYVQGEECFTLVDPEHGTLKLQIGLPPTPISETLREGPSQSFGRAELASPENVATETPAQDVPAEDAPADGAPAEASISVEKPPLEVVPEGWMIRDIGEQSCEGLRLALRRSRGVLWNGALGMVEDERFQFGTRTFLAHCGYRISGGDEEDDDDLAAVDDEEEEEEEEGDQGEGGEREAEEKEVEFETSIVIGRDSSRMLPMLYDTPAPFAFESKSGETLLEILRGKSLPGLLACAEKDRT